MGNYIGWALFICGALGGLYFIGLIAYNFWPYFLCDGTSCHEFLMIPAIGSLFATPCWLASSVGVYMIDEQINKTVQYFVYTIAFISTSTFIYFLIYG